MDFKDLVLKNRSYRRFDEEFVIDRETLVELIELARHAASGRNAQPLKYFLSNDKVVNELIFSTLTWAGYLKTWPGPKEGERPSAYIVVLLDRDISDNFLCDDGIAMQNILLGAVDKGLGGCILRAINKPRLSAILNLTDRFEIIDVVALGKPIEKVVITNIKEDGDIKYYRDENGVHYVPKRSVDDLII
ncbi:MAG: nitroreductase family protein [Mariniphaga sp.]|nr:nitroreductase family protein [Mariniphaga sp.]